MAVYTLFGQPSSPGVLQSDNAAYTLGMQFRATKASASTAIWWYSAPGTTILPSQIAIFATSSGTLVHSETATWSGAAGSGWVRAQFSNPVNLTATTDYNACVFCSGGSNWYSAVNHYWDTGAGTNGITKGILFAPGNATSAHGQDTFYQSSSLTFPSGTYNGSNYWIDVEVTDTYVNQSAVPATHGNGNGNVAATFGTNLSAGTKLIAYLQVADGNAGNNPSCTGVSDGNGNSFTKVADVAASGTTGPNTYNGHYQIWVLDTPIGDAGTKPTVTAALSGSSGVYGDLLVQEVTGLLTGTNCLDGSPWTNAGTATTNYSTGSPTYSSGMKNEFLVSFYADNGGSGTPRPTWTAPSGYALDSNSINSQLYGNIGVAYKNSTGGAESGNWSVTSSTFDIWGTITVAFKTLPWNVLQSFSAANFSGSTVGQAVAQNLSSNSKLIAYVAQNSGNNAAAITANDGNGNNFTQAFRQTWDWSGSSEYITLTMLVMDTPAGDVGTKPTFNFTTSNSYNVAVVLEEVSGLAIGTDCLDGTVGYTEGSLGSAGTTSSPSYTSTATNEFLVSMVADGWTTAAVTAPSGYKTDQIWPGGGGGPNLGVAYKPSTNGAESSGWTTSNADHYLTATVAFKLAVSPITYNTGTVVTANNQTNIQFTIPAGVKTGDVMLLNVQCYTETTTQPTIAMSNGIWQLVPMTDGSANPLVASGGGFYNYGYAYYRVATATDISATVTVSESGSSGSTTWWAVGLASYTGANQLNPIDRAGSAAANAGSVTLPTETSRITNNYAVFLGGGGSSNGTLTGPNGQTQRQQLVSSADIGASIYDSNAPTGLATVGGGTFSTGASGWLTAFTICLAPAGTYVVQTLNSNVWNTSLSSNATKGNTLFMFPVSYAVGANTYTNNPQYNSASAKNASQIWSVQSNSGTNDMYSACWMLPNLPSSSTGIGIFVSSGNEPSPLCANMVMEVLGLGPNPVVDRSATASGSNGNSVIGPIGATQYDNELIIAQGAIYGTYPSNGPGAPWTDKTDPTNQHAIISWQTNAAKGSTFTWTENGNGSPWAGGLATIRIPAWTIDPSTPATATAAAGNPSTVTSPTFAPPAGSVIAALVSSGYGGSATPVMHYNITDNTNGQLTWSARTVNPAPTSTHDAFAQVITTTVPAGGLRNTLFGQPASPGTFDSDTAQYTLGNQFSASQACTATAVWWYSVSGAGILPDQIAIYRVSDQSLVHSEAANWSGAVGTGWVRAAFTAPQGLTALTDYKVCVRGGDGTHYWYSDAFHYWDTGAGASGITNGILSAPNHANSAQGQSTYYRGSSLGYPTNEYIATNFWIDIEVTGGALAVTATQAGGSGYGGGPIALLPLVVNGVQETGGANLGTDTSNSNPDTASLSPKFTGSLPVFAMQSTLASTLVQSANNAFGYTATPNSTAVANGHYAGPVTGGSALTLGSSSSVAGQGAYIAVYELPLAGSASSGGQPAGVLMIGIV